MEGEQGSGSATTRSEIFEPAVTSRAIEAAFTFLTAAIGVGIAFGFDLHGTSSSFLFGVVAFAIFGSAVSVSVWLMLRKGTRVAPLPRAASVRPAGGILQEVVPGRLTWDAILLALTLLTGKYGAGILVGVSIVGPLTIAFMLVEQRRQGVEFFMTGKRGVLGMPRSSGNGPRFWVLTR